MTLKVKVMHNINLSKNKGNDLEFQGHAIENFNSALDSLTRKHTHEQFHNKIRSGSQKSRGWSCNNPLALNVGRNSLVEG